MLVNPIDLNADLGEGFPNDEALLDRVTSASICCGAHAGDRRTAALTIRAGHARGVTLGAHPGYPDRERFGRRPWQTTAEEVETLVRRQLRALFEWAEDEGAAIRFLKPHGALYQQAQVDAEVASGIVAAATGTCRSSASHAAPSPQRPPAPACGSWPRASPIAATRPRADSRRAPSPTR